MVLNYEGEGEPEDHDDNDEEIFEYLGNDVVEHDAKLSVWYPMNLENPISTFGGSLKPMSSASIKMNMERLS